ncbi:MAG: hypothetical protein ACXW3Z_16205 [Limisphaerales bacterium]
MEIHQKAKIAVWSVALLVAAPVAGGEKVQITGSTSIELPKPTHILEDAKRIRAHDGPSGRSEYEGGVPQTGPLMNTSPQMDRKLKDAIDKKKNWIFVNPYEMQFDNKTEEFLKAERGTGLYNHRLLKEEEKGVVERFVQENANEREADSNFNEPNSRNERGGDQQETLRGLRDEVLPGEKGANGRMETGFSLSGTLEPKSELYTERTDFQKRLERSPFSESIFGSRTTPGMSVEDREARDAELSKIYQPRVTAAPQAGGGDPVNRSFDATRQEATPFSARRSEQIFNVGRADATAAAGRTSPTFAGPGFAAPSGLDLRSSSRTDFSDFGSRAPSSLAPNAAVAPAPAASASFSPAPFVLPRPTRKF